MKSKFALYLIQHDLEIYDVAKMLRDSDWNKSSKQPRTRQAFVRLLWLVIRLGWGTLNSRNGKIVGVYSHGYDGVLSAWRVAQTLDCTIIEIV